MTSVMTPWPRLVTDHTGDAGVSLELVVDQYGTVLSVRPPATATAAPLREWAGRQLVDVLSPADRSQAIRLILCVTSSGRRAYAVWQLDLGLGLEPLSIAAEHDRAADTVVFTGLRMADVAKELEGLADLAFQDGLTDLVNRSLFLRHLDRELLRSRRTGATVAVVLADVNNLKRVNDTYGHQVGDHLLVEVARRLTQACRPADVPARLSGDEFAVLCPDLLPGTDPTVIVRRLQEHISGPALIGGYPIDISIAIGVAVATADGNPDEDGLDLLNRADLDMYVAKASSRG